MIRGPKPTFIHPLDFTVTITKSISFMWFPKFFTKYVSLCKEINTMKFLYSCTILLQKGICFDDIFDFSLRSFILH